MSANTKKLTELKTGEEAIISHLLPSELALKLTEMGCLPGTKIKMENPAPLGDPIKITIENDYQLALRKEEAQIVMLKNV